MPGRLTPSHAMSTPELSPADVVSLALDALTAALDAPSHDDATFDARAVLADLDEAALRRVAACLAVLAAWELPPARGRRARLRRWVDGFRLRVTWQES